MPRSTHSVVVSDTGPLIALGRLDLLHLLLHLLPALFTQVQVPQAVINECMARPQNVDASRIQLALDQRWLTPCDAKSISIPGLDLGERAAIARALEIGAGLLAHLSQLAVAFLGIGLFCARK